MDRFLPFTERLAVLALAGVLALIGCGGGSGEGGGAAPASQEQREETEGQDGGPEREENDEDAGDQDGEDGGDDGNESSSSQSNSITQSSEGGSSSSSSSSSNVNGRGVKTFSGSGSTTLTFNVEQPSRFAWTNAEGQRFSATGGGISIDSRAGRGEVALEAGRYDDVRIRGSSWTIVVRPR